MKDINFIKNNLIGLLLIIFLLSILWFGCMPPNTSSGSGGGGGSDSTSLPSGTFLWSKRLGGTAQDIGYGITTDADNNIIVTGSVTGNADLNGDGDTSDIGEDITGSTLYGNGDIFLSKFNSSGTFQWAKRLGGVDEDGGASVAVSMSDNICITGIITGNVDLNGDGVISAGLPETTTGTYGNKDVFISKFNSEGTLNLFTTRLGGVNDDGGYSIKFDYDRNIIITGAIIGSADLNGNGNSTDGGPEGTLGFSEDDIFISRFNSDHSFDWAKRLGGLNYDKGYSISTNSSLNIIVTGIIEGNADLNGNGTIEADLPETTTGTYGEYDIFTSFFLSNGTAPLDAMRLGGIESDEGHGITFDNSNNVIVVGWVTGNADLNMDNDFLDEGENSTGYGSIDIIIAKYSSPSVLSWAKRLGGISGEGALGVITDENNNIFVLGVVYGDADLNGDGDYDDGGESATGYGGSDIFIVKFSSDGTYQWSKRLGGTVGDFGTAITVDNNNNVIVTGWIANDADLNGDGIAESSGYGSYDIFIAKFTN